MTSTLTSDRGDVLEFEQFTQVNMALVWLSTVPVKWMEQDDYGVLCHFPGNSHRVRILKKDVVSFTGA